LRTATRLALSAAGAGLLVLVLGLAGPASRTAPRVRYDAASDAGSVAPGPPSIAAKVALAGGRDPVDVEAAGTGRPVDRPSASLFDAVAGAPPVAASASSSAPSSGPEEPGTGSAPYGLARGLELAAEARTRQSVFLFGLEAAPEDPGPALLGLDREAPRALVVWEVVAERGVAARVARAASGPDGRISTGPLLLGAGPLTLVVAPVGADAFGPLASAPLAVAPLAVEPPNAWLELPPRGAADGSPALVVAASGGGFTLLAGDAYGREIARFDVPAPPVARRGARLLRLEEPAGVRWVARMLPDGRRSGWLALEPREPTHAAATPSQEDPS